MQPPKQVDVQVLDPPTDTITDVAFSPQADLLAAASWDNNVRIYRLGPDGNAEPWAMYAHDRPAFACTWSRDGSKLVSAGADNLCRMMEVATGQQQVVAAHASTIRCAEFFDMHGAPILVTGGWDKIVKYWDLRTPNPVGSVAVAERVYAMDALFPALVVGTADRHIQIIDLKNSGVVMQTTHSPLKWQTRCITCFRPSGGKGSGYAIGSIEGRVAINYLDQNEADKENFTFRCHRDAQKVVHAVHSIVFHPVYNTTCTAGGDGTFCYWDKDARSRLTMFDYVGGPITASAFDRTGRVYAYGVGDDWMNVRRVAFKLPV